MSIDAATLKNFITTNGLKYKQTSNVLIQNAVRRGSST